MQTLWYGSKNYPRLSKGNFGEKRIPSDSLILTGRPGKCDELNLLSHAQETFDVYEDATLRERKDGEVLWG